MIKVDKEKCIGCGVCTAICPKVFKLREDDLKAEVIGSEATAECVDQAIESCPTQAISK